MMRRRRLSIAGLIIFAAGVVLGLAAVGGCTSSPGRNSNPRELPGNAGRHVTRADSESMLGLQNATPAPAQMGGGPLQMVPPTRSSFMASWQKVSGAIGYRLDVSTSASFDSYVNGYHDLDVGNVTGHPVTGLSQGTTYYYQVRAYDAVGAIIGMSEAMSVTTVTTTGLIIHPTFDSSITGN